ncbi:MAG: translation initiation factor IF-2 [Fimbriimonadaceae bacterium]|nr:translation initiation factor IF-2 [Fimbriimonadaceae bacterium]
MLRKISELATKWKVAPGQILAACHELGVETTDGQFEVGDDDLELIREAAAQQGKTIALAPNRTPRDIAAAMGVTDKEVQTALIKKFKVMATLTTVLAQDVAENLAKEFGFSLTWAEPSAPKASRKLQPGKGGPVKRPPVVTIMGHVDHGKTSILDYIRKANVVSKEFGGITQHIGAYQVTLPQGVITFLDTPGHAAFTAMRARGASVTDIAILVVAADDGIMPQTQEAIQHAKTAGVPMIVAVNKIDKPSANVDKVVMTLPNYDVIPEAYGGEVIICPVSAHTGEGVPNLLEMILLQADVMELKADPKADFRGVIIEAQLDKGRGPVATVLVQQGTLRVGDVIVAGNTWGKIKAMTDYAGEKVKEAIPAMPVEILGLSEVPGAGDRADIVKDERAARDLTSDRVDAEKLRNAIGMKKRLTLRDLRRQMDQEEVKDLNLIVKGDVQGSVEAVRGLIEKLSHPEVNVRILASGVGSITESDVLLGSASNAIVVGFNTKPEPKAKAEAERQKVEIRTYTIIYELIEDIESALKGMLAPKYEEEYQATVEVRAVFKLTKSGKVAGCHVTDGKIFRNSKVRVKRDREIVFEGELDSLKNVKQDVREMFAGQDCGIKFVGWEDFKEGDVIEAYELVQVN